MTWRQAANTAPQLLPPMSSLMSPKPQVELTQHKAAFAADCTTQPMRGPGKDKNQYKTHQQCCDEGRTTASDHSLPLPRGSRHTRLCCQWQTKPGEDNMKPHAQWDISF